jgi:trigger factor
VGAHVALDVAPGDLQGRLPPDLRQDRGGDPEEAKPDAEQALRREAVIAAVIEAEGIEPSDGDVLDALQASAARENATPEKLRDRLEAAGRLDELREDLAQRAAIDYLTEHATPVAPK